ncbi:aerobic carbon-monoxide dehydrogenase small subunit [Burkholderiales bacterium]|nr:MAG: (2Fe-2S)-binding protein [Burkholderiales bacterium]CAG0956936.1 aerobic carbon-monoxide dehydrogenase small subunit [Burkholderiales bacterium]
MSLKTEIEFTLNGVKRRATVPVEMSTLDLLRDVVGLTGTKYGCGEGECGACTIEVDGTTVNSCLMFAVDCAGRNVNTIESLAGEPLGERLRAAFVEQGAVQCGFCTPGMMMQAAHVLSACGAQDDQAIARGIEGNLCRCTGYKKIVEAIAVAGKATGA